MGVAELCYNAINRTVFFGGDPDLPGQIAAAAEAGFRLFGPDTFSLDAWTAAGKPVEELAERLEAAGMRCFEIAALDVGEEGPTLEQARHVAEMAAVLRPEWILTNVMSAPIDDRLLATFAQVCDVLAESGARPAVEYLPWTTEIWRDPPKVEDGQLVFSDAPGLGLELDQAAVKRLTVS